LAHPVRVKEDIPAVMPELCDAALNAIEAYHSDHSADDTALYLDLAGKYGLLVTGGSDFHGDAKARRAAGQRLRGKSEDPGRTRTIPSLSAAVALGRCVTISTKTGG